jgi:dUTP pyrophosphatase
MSEFNFQQFSLEKYMHLKIFIDSNDQSLKTKYIDYIYQREAKMIKDPEHIDAGFDIFVPHDVELNNRLVNKIDFMISCSAQIVKRVDKEYNCIETHNTGYYMYPRSSISKTHLRLANNVGIIDAGYRGHLMGMFDVLYHDHDLLTVNKFDRLLQICAPELIPIYVELVDSKDKLGGKTIRGDGGFGSTGV